MRTLVLDIETVGERWKDIDETSKEALTRWIKKESGSSEEYKAKLGDLKDGLGFSPLTGAIVAIGAYDLEKEKGAVYFHAPKHPIIDSVEGAFHFRSMDEASMLREFWKGAKEYDTFVTFNGRAFDAPFLAIRSLVHGIRPSRDLLTNRYTSLQRGCQHIDLADQLSFYGASRFRGANLHLYCRALGIESPKAKGVAGDDVAELFERKEYLAIARYNARDLIATAALYERWRDVLA